jgi:hypothetical protein
MKEVRYLRPFEDWKDEEQCTGQMWVDSDSNGDWRVCAWGRLIQVRIDERLAAAFDRWCMRNFGASVIELNDEYEAKPASFRFWWDCFMADAENRDVLDFGVIYE